MRAWRCSAPRANVRGPPPCRSIWGGPWRVARFWSAREVRQVLEAAGLVPRRVRGAVFYPRSRVAARAFALFEAALGSLTTVGAAFIALVADKPANSRAADPRPLSRMAL